MGKNNTSSELNESGTVATNSSNDKRTMSPLRERNRDRVRNDLIEAATELIDEQGYEDVTIADIVDRAGMSYSSYFRYFKSKEDLVLSIEQACWNNYTSVFTLLAESKNPFSAMLEGMVSEIQKLDDDATKAKEVFRNQLLIMSNPTLRAAYLLKDAERTETIGFCLAERTGADYNTDLNLKFWVARISMVGRITLDMTTSAFSDCKPIKAMDILQSLLGETGLLAESKRLSKAYPVKP